MFFNKLEGNSLTVVFLYLYYLYFYNFECKMFSLKDIYSHSISDSIRNANKILLWFPDLDSNYCQTYTEIHWIWIFIHKICRIKDILVSCSIKLLYFDWNVLSSWKNLKWTPSHMCKIQCAGRCIFRNMSDSNYHVTCQIKVHLHKVLKWYHTACKTCWVFEHYGTFF